MTSQHIGRRVLRSVGRLPSRLLGKISPSSTLRRPLKSYPPELHVRQTHLQNYRKQPSEVVESVYDISSLIPAVRAYRLPPDVLPLAKERTPFSELSDDLIAGAISRVLQSSTRKGRFTDAIRALLNVTIPNPERYAVIEAHIDLTGITPSLLCQLISLGFEPDNFAEIHPPQYIRHFTIQHRIPWHQAASSQLFTEVRQAASMAAIAIENSSDITGYVETECYTTRRIMKFAAAELVPSKLKHFPFQEATFTRLKVACTDADLGAPGYDVVEKRAADIHIKLAPPATEQLGEPRLERLLQNSAFYRIRSDAGNYMYSAHFSTLSDANMAYDQITAFASIGGGISSIMREVCTSLWRKTDLKTGFPMRAEVPPHLRFQAGSIA